MPRAGDHMLEGIEQYGAGGSLVRQRLAASQLHHPMAEMRKLLTKSRRRTNCGDAHESMTACERHLDRIDAAREAWQWQRVVDECRGLESELGWLDCMARDLRPSKAASAMDAVYEASVLVAQVRHVAFCETLAGGRCRGEEV
jgi:hypothetical protein